MEERPWEQGGKAAGGLIVKEFVGKEEDFKVDALRGLGANRVCEGQG